MLQFNLDKNVALPNDSAVVVCLCAEWCGTCRGYQEAFTALASSFPDYVFVWLDVEDDAELVEDLDIETFPTVMLMRGDAVLFGGILLPHIQHLERLLSTLADRTPQPEDEFSALARRLKLLL